MRLNMRLNRAILLGGTAFLATATALHADDLPAGLEVMDTGKLAVEAAPSLPALTDVTPAAPLPPLPAAAAPRIIGAAGAPSSAPSVSWSGYTRAGVVYRGGK